MYLPAGQFMHVFAALTYLPNEHERAGVGAIVVVVAVVAVVVVAL